MPLTRRTGLIGAAALLTDPRRALLAAPGDAPPHDLAALLEPLRRRHALPALAGAIVTAGGLRALGAVGVRKSGDPTPVTSADRFHLGSCTKSMTATLLATLVEEGRLRWEDTLGQRLSRLAPKMLPEYRSVTLEQVLAHRGGFPPPERSWLKGCSFLDMHHLPGPPREQRRAYVAGALSQPPEYTPGSKFMYSNMGYSVAAAAAEELLDESWEVLIAARVFRPLGMSSAGFGPMGRAGAVEQPWQHLKRDGRVQPVPPGPLADNPPVIAPGGRVHSSLGDWARYVALHLRGERGEPGLLKPEGVRRLHTPPAGSEYGFGWTVTERPWAGGRVLTHTGSNRTNFAVVWLAPRRDFAVLAATNQGGEGADQACDEAASALIRHHLEPSRPSRPVTRLITRSPE